MRIALVSAHYAPVVGGVEKHMTEIATRLAARGNDVRVLTHAEPSSQLPPVENAGGVEVRRFPVPIPSSNYAFSPALSRHLHGAGDRYDIVHAHGYHTLPALQSALARPAALVFTPHYHGTGHSPFRKLLHPPYRQLGRLIFARAGRTIAVSPPEAELIVGHFPAVRPRLVVIPNGVPQQAIDAAEPFPDSRTVLLSAGRLEVYKQVDRAIAALAELPEEFVLRITGDGPARAALEQQAAALGAGDRVRFLGRVPEEDLYRWLRTTAVYVSMSSNEAMPVTFIECLAAGARVVASDIPAHRALVTKTGGSIELVPIDADGATVADAVQAVLARALAVARVDTWDEVVDSTLAVYERVLEEASGDRVRV